MGRRRERAGSGAGADAAGDSPGGGGEAEGADGEELTAAAAATTTTTTGDNPPLLSTLATLDEVHTAALLVQHVQWAAAEGELGELAAAWLFALAAAVATPLTPDTAAALRQLVRFCCQRRLQVCALSAPNDIAGGGHPRRCRCSQEPVWEAIERCRKYGSQTYDACCSVWACPLTLRDPPPPPPPPGSSWVFGSAGALA